MSVAEATPRELVVRHAHKDGREVAVLRVLDYGDAYVVKVEVFPAGAETPVAPGPYSFADAPQATRFMTETVEALMYLGCDVSV